MCDGFVRGKIVLLEVDREWFLSIGFVVDEVLVFRFIERQGEVFQSKRYIFLASSFGGFFQKLNMTKRKKNKMVEVACI